jgi:hypothetical protein
MTTDIRERAEIASREWDDRRPHPAVSADAVTYLEVAAYRAGWVDGYEAARAEYRKLMTPKRIRRAVCPFDVDDLDEERHGKL